jgi:isoquinoline 1-oxidoreductase subunit beta
MMRRRTFLGAGLVALIGAGAAVWSRVPVIPARPAPDADAALGWIAHHDSRFVLTLPRVEMGQNIATALQQVACAELGVAPEAVTVHLHDTRMARLRATVGSESVQHFAEPLAQACAALREALAAGRTAGHVSVTRRPLSALRAFRPGGLIGASPTLAQGREIVMGAPLYAADVSRPGMLFGRVLRTSAPVEWPSRPKHWDEGAARIVPGYAGIVTDCGPPIGQAVGLGILATRPGALEAIAEALAIEWEVARGPTPDLAALIDVDAGQGLPHRVLDGDPQPGAWDVDLRIDLPPAAHAPLEPRAAVADWQGDGLTVWAGTQDAFYVRDVLSHELGLAEDAVTVQSMRVGGAFGGKTICTVEAEAAALARAAGAPVKVQWTRAQEFAFAFHRPPSSHRIRARLRGGQITDWDHAQVSSHILFTAAVVPSWMQRGTDLFLGDSGVARGMAAPYALGRGRAAYDAVRLPVHTGPWRGLGAGPNGLAIESAMDDAARAAGSDPLAFRLAHIEDQRLAGVLRHVAEAADWGRPPTPAPGRRGRGIACGIYKGTSYAAVVADVAIDPTGQVRVTQMWCAHDCGLIINPDQVRAQCEGNLVWSIGMVLSDRLDLTTEGVSAETFADAPIPRLVDVPPITVALVDSPHPPTGAGETAIAAGPGAIANAIRDATGIRLGHFPVEPSMLALDS